jgi:hypothetical protein
LICVGLDPIQIFIGILTSEAKLWLLLILDYDTLTRKIIWIENLSWVIGYLLSWLGESFHQLEMVIGGLRIRLNSLSWDATAVLSEGGRK